MKTYDQLTQQRTKILNQICALGPMRMGSITEQYLPYKLKDGSIRRRGPNFTYTFKKGGKSAGKHLRDKEQVEIYGQQIETFRKWQALSKELVEVSQCLADMEAEDNCDGKKNSKS